MGKKQSKKKAKKRKARERRIRKDRKHLSERRKVAQFDRTVRRVAPFPEFKIVNDGAAGPIEDMVREGLKLLERQYTGVLSDDTIATLAIQSREGWDGYVTMMCDSYDSELSREAMDRYCSREMERDLGTALLFFSPEHLKRRSLPMSCFSLVPEDKHWLIKCRSVRALETNHGVVYQSPHRPRVSVNMGRRQVAYTKHAMLQLADRLMPRWNQLHISLLYVFGFFYECVYFDVTKLRGGQPALVVYNSCLRAGDSVRQFMQELAEVDSVADLKNHYYIVGYCPLTFEKGLAVAKTFLTPGYRQTPERRTLKKSSRIEVTRDIEMASDAGINVLDIATDERTRLAIRWFHENGVPQVKRLDRTVFKDITGPYGWMTPDDVKDPTEAA